MQDSIIIYRNPGEKWFWEQGGFLQIGVLVIVFLVAFWITLKVAEYTLPEKHFAKYGTTVAIIDGIFWAVGAVITIFYI